ncbi:hypothetical protein [Microbulbifer sp.]|uniref:hypothetical protein n=1 Tax=Microbulbifer sp. TaxID=1908541 RepID=UPI003F3F01CF
MAPMAAILTVFALTFAAISWLSLLRACFRQGTVTGLLAFFLPPLGLLLLLPRWEEEAEPFATAAAALVFISIAGIF